MFLFYFCIHIGLGLSQQMTTTPTERCKKAIIVPEFTQIKIGVIYDNVTLATQWNTQTDELLYKDRDWIRNNLFAETNIKWFLPINIELVLGDFEIINDGVADLISDTNATHTPLMKWHNWTKDNVKIKEMYELHDLLVVLVDAGRLPAYKKGIANKGVTCTSASISGDKTLTKIAMVGIFEKIITDPDAFLYDSVTFGHEIFHTIGVDDEIVVAKDLLMSFTPVHEGPIRIGESTIREACEYLLTNRHTCKCVTDVTKCPPKEASSKCRYKVGETAMKHVGCGDMQCVPSSCDMSSSMCYGECQPKSNFHGCKVFNITLESVDPMGQKKSIEGQFRWIGPDELFQIALAIDLNTLNTPPLCFKFVPLNPNTLSYTDTTFNNNTRWGISRLCNDQIDIFTRKSDGLSKNILFDAETLWQEMKIHNLQVYYLDWRATNFKCLTTHYWECQARILTTPADATMIMCKGILDKATCVENILCEEFVGCVAKNKDDATDKEHCENILAELPCRDAAKCEEGSFCKAKESEGQLADPTWRNNCKGAKDKDACEATDISYTTNCEVRVPEIVPGTQVAENCLWDHWEEWTACDLSCGTQFKIRVRYKLQLMNNAGTECIGERREQEDCNLTECTTTTTVAPVIYCQQDEKVVNQLCVACDAGYGNKAGDPDNGGDTDCEYMLCAINQRVFINLCKDCLPGSYNDAGDDKRGATTECTPTLCGLNEKVINHECVACEIDTHNPEGDDATGEDTECPSTLCEANHYVKQNECTPCEKGEENPEGDDATSHDTTCTTTICSENYHVQSNECVECPPGTIRAAGDHATNEDTACEPIYCGENEKVGNFTCVPCQAGAIKTINGLGDIATGADTDCDPFLCEFNQKVFNHLCEDCPLWTYKKAGDDSSQEDTMCGVSCVYNQNHEDCFAEFQVVTKCVVESDVLASDCPDDSTQCICKPPKYTLIIEKDITIPVFGDKYKFDVRPLETEIRKFTENEINGPEIKVNILRDPQNGLIRRLKVMDRNQNNLQLSKSSNSIENILRIYIQDLFMEEAVTHKSKLESNEFTTELEREISRQTTLSIRITSENLDSRIGHTIESEVPYGQDSKRNSGASEYICVHENEIYGGHTTPTCTGLKEMRCIFEKNCKQLRKDWLDQFHLEDEEPAEKKEKPSGGSTKTVFVIVLIVSIIVAVLIYHFGRKRIIAAYQSVMGSRSSKIKSKFVNPHLVKSAPVRESLKHDSAASLETEKDINDFKKEPSRGRTTTGTKGRKGKRSTDKNKRDVINDVIYE